MLYKNETLISHGYGAWGKQYWLAHVAAGEEIAGSGTRHVEECYRVIWVFDGNRHSRAYKSLADAQAYFNSYTQPIVEQRA